MRAVAAVGTSKQLPCVCSGTERAECRHMGPSMRRVSRSQGVRNRTLPSTPTVVVYRLSATGALLKSSTCLWERLGCGKRAISRLCRRQLCVWQRCHNTRLSCVRPSSVTYLSCICHGPGGLRQLVHPSGGLPTGSFRSGQWYRRRTAHEPMSAVTSVVPTNPASWLKDHL